MRSTAQSEPPEDLRQPHRPKPLPLRLIAWLTISQQLESSYYNEILHLMIMCALARVWACVGISPVCTRSRHSLYVHSPYHHRVLERHAPFPAAAVNALTLAFICTYVPSPPLARYLSPVRERSPGLVLVHDTWICIFRLLIEKSLNRSPKRNHRYKSGIRGKKTPALTRVPQREPDSSDEEEERALLLGGQGK